MDLNDLRGTNRRLDLPRDDSNRSEALFIIVSPTDASEALEGEVVVDTFGADDSKLTVRIRKSEPSVLKGVLEAAFAAWRQRLADAADSLDQLTSADARIIGQLDVPGRPLLTELRAERRRGLKRNDDLPLWPVGPTRHRRHPAGRRRDAHVISSGRF